MSFVQLGGKYLDEDTESCFFQLNLTDFHDVNKTPATPHLDWSDLYCTCLDSDTMKPNIRLEQPSV